MFPSSQAYLPPSQLIYNSSHDMISSMTDPSNAYMNYDISGILSTNVNKDFDFYVYSPLFPECEVANLFEEEMSSQSLYSALKKKLNSFENLSIFNSTTREQTPMFQEGKELSQPNIISTSSNNEMDHIYFVSENGENCSSKQVNQKISSPDLCKSDCALLLKLGEGKDQPFDQKEKVISKNIETYELSSLSIGNLKEIPAKESIVQENLSLNVNNLYSSNSGEESPVFQVSNTMIASKKVGNYKKKTRQVLYKLMEWFVLRGKEKTVFGKITERVMTAFDAAKKMGTSKKTLDYYQLIIRKSIALGTRINISDYLDCSFGDLAEAVRITIQGLEGEEKKLFKNLNKSKEVKVGVYEYVMNS